MRPVDRAAVELVLPHVARQVAAMIELQWLTGMRPQEVVQMRMAEIDRGGRVWLYRPREHKVEHHGMDRVIPIGPIGHLRVRRVDSSAEGHLVAGNGRPRSAGIACQQLRELGRDGAQDDADE